MEMNRDEWKCRENHVYEEQFCEGGGLMEVRDRRVVGPSFVSTAENVKRAPEGHFTRLSEVRSREGGNSHRYAERLQVGGGYETQAADLSSVYSVGKSEFARLGGVAVFV